MPNNLTPEERRRLNEQLQAEMNARNSQGLAEFQGLTPGQMHYLIRSPFEEGCIVRFQDADYRVYEDIPMLLLVRALLEELNRGPIKLTPKGNLPMKVVRSLYDLRLVKDEHIESGLNKLNTQDNWNALIFADELLRALEMIGEKPKGKLQLAPAGKAALEGSLQSLFEQLFLVSFQQFNLGYFDGHPPNREIQAFTGYTIYLLLKNGKDWLPSSFYADAFITAWPTILKDFTDRHKSPADNFRHAFQLRIFKRFMEWFGLVRFKTNDRFGIREVMATDLFRHVFKLDMEAQRPERPEDADIQIKQALFDAEMGSESWVSNDIPPEIQDAFHNQIRAFHGQLDEDELVTIRSIMEGVEMPSTATLKSEEELVEDIARLVSIYRSRGVMPVPPTELDDFDSRVVHEFITGNDLLDFKVAKPVEGMIMPIYYQQVMGLPVPETTPYQESDDFDHYTMAEVAEDFLIGLLILEEPFDPEILASEIRLDGGVVSRLKGLHHVNKWRDQYERIEPLGFQAGPTQGNEPTCFQFIRVAYKVYPKGGGEAILHDGEGVIQIVEEGDDFCVQGASFPGFEF